MGMLEDLLEMKRQLDEMFPPVEPMIFKAKYGMGWLSNMFSPRLRMIPDGSYAMACRLEEDINTLIEHHFPADCLYIAFPGGTVFSPSKFIIVMKVGGDNNYRMLVDSLENRKHADVMSCVIDLLAEMSKEVKNV
jgi:hypothetical protein